MHHGLPCEVLLQRRTALPRQLEILLRAHRHGVHTAEADVEEGEGDVVDGGERGFAVTAATNIAPALGEYERHVEKK